MSKITIVTPTINRPLPVLRRCLASVDRQTLPDWEHVICSDGKHEPQVAELVREGQNPRRRYCYIATDARHFGAGVRAALLPQVDTEYVAFLDDDNLLFPRYCERMIQALDANQTAGFAVCQILHFGPLLPAFGLPPAILTGVPPTTNNVDTLQVVARTKAMRECGWVLAGYGSDGATFEKLAGTHSYVEVSEVLAAHL